MLRAFSQYYILKTTTTTRKKNKKCHEQRPLWFHIQLNKLVFTRLMLENMETMETLCINVEKSMPI
jgi:hypothetical protein